MPTHYERVMAELRAMGFAEWQAQDLIEACSPRWTLSAVKMVLSDKRETLFLLVKGSRNILPEERHKKISNKEELIRQVFRQAGWIIPSKVSIKAYLHCANLAFKYSTPL